MFSVRVVKVVVTWSVITMCGLLAVGSHANAAPVTQATSPAGSDSSWNTNGWTWQALGSVTLGAGTNTVLDLTSTVTLVDQGWGGEDPGGNQVLISLFDNGIDLWDQHVAGATHSSTTETFDITDTTTNPTALTTLDAALAGIDWSTSPTVTLQMNATPIAWLGWELHTSNASFSVTSDSSPVPEPISITLFGTALTGLGLIRRRKAG